MYRPAKISNLQISLGNTKKTVQILIGSILTKFQFSIHILPLFLAEDSLVLCHGESLFFHDNISMHLQVELHTKKINVILST